MGLKYNKGVYMSTNSTAAGIENSLEINEPLLGSYGNTLNDMAGAEYSMLDQIKDAKSPFSMGGESAGGFDMGGMFKADKIGGTLQGIGAIAGAAAGIYDAYNKKKYQDKVFGMEEKRVARETERQDKQQGAYEKVFG